MKRRQCSDCLMLIMRKQESYSSYTNLHARLTCLAARLLCSISHCIMLTAYCPTGWYNFSCRITIFQQKLYIFRFKEYEGVTLDLLIPICIHLGKDVYPQLTLNTTLLTYMSNSNLLTAGEVTIHGYHNSLCASA